MTNHPFRPGERTGGGVAASATHALRPGDLVQIRSKSEIARTVGENGKTRGLWFDREMLPYCGQTARVKAKVEHFIDEDTGRMIHLASDCYILDDVVCKSYRSSSRWFCPRAIYPWWREGWLRPAEPEAAERRQTRATGDPASIACLRPIGGSDRRVEPSAGRGTSRGARVTFGARIQRRQR